MSAGTLPHSSTRSAEASRLKTSLLMSAGVHVVLAGAVFWAGTREEPPRPPVYRVNLIGAPAGPRQVGVVENRPAPPAQSSQPVASGAEQVTPPPKVAPTKSNARSAPTPAKATPTPNRSRTAGSATPANSRTTTPQRAGSGRQGGKGADVVNLRTEGIAFPDQGYLNNIVRQLTLAWTPRESSAALITEVRFTIHRNGSVSDVQVVKASGNRLYDIEAQGAIDAVAQSRRFGPLPAAWQDEVLVVYFTFDYALLR